ncbi:ribonuclease H-like domain-containing protein [Tanacetum coccineum]
MVLLEETVLNNELFSTSSSSLTVLLASHTSNRHSKFMASSGIDQCRNFQRGACTYGNSCKFVHEIHDTRPKKTSTQPMVPYYYATGPAAYGLPQPPGPAQAHMIHAPDYQTHKLLLRCDSTVELYPVRHQSPPHTLFALISFSQSTWHRRLGHPSENLGKHIKLPFVSSESRVKSMFEHVHSDLWTSLIPSNFVHRHKFNAYGSLSKYKARLMENDRSQQQGIDCDETFSLMVKSTTIRIVLSLVVSRHWPIHQLDVKNTFLHGHLIETVYMHQPPGFVDAAHLDYIVCALQYFTFTCLDLSYAVQQLHISFIAQLTAYTDGDWASYYVTSHSTSGYYIVLNIAVLLMLLLRQLSTVYLSTNLVQHQRTKHIKIDIHFLRDFVASGEVRVLHVPSCFQYADIFTKGLPSALFIEF